MLVVDDDKTLVEIFKDFFSTQYDIVDSTSDSVEASNMIISNEYDIILSDLDMPNLNGLDLFMTAKTNKKLAKFYILTGSSVSISHNVDGVFRKPAQLRDIANAIKST